MLLGMHISYSMDINSLLLENNYHRFLDVEDPLDKLIIDFAEKGELKVGFVKVKPGSRFAFKKHFSNFLKHMLKLICIN